MERKYKLTLEEMNQITDWNSKKIVTGDMEEFQKFLLELRRNIVLGGESYGEIDYYSYMDDDEVTIRFGSNSFAVAPRPFVTNKPLFSNVIKKILMYPYLNEVIKHIQIKDMIIDANSFSLINEYKLRELNFENCYFEDNVRIGFFSIDNLEFTYCSIPNLNIISGIEMKKLIIDKTKVRSEKKGAIEITASTLSIKDSVFYTNDLLYKLNLPNLTNLTINKKVFDDADLILLNKIAPNLKHAEISATISDINTIDYISLLPFYSVDSSYDKSKLLNNILIKDIQAHSKLNFSLKGNKGIREEIIKKLENALSSIYTIPSFNEGDLLLESCENKYEELKNELITNLTEYVKRFEKHFDISKLLLIVADLNLVDYKIGKYLEYKDKAFEKFINREKNEDFKSSYIIAYENGYRESILSIIDKYHELVGNFHRSFSEWFNEQMPIYQKKLLASNIEASVKEELYELSFNTKFNYPKNNYVPGYRDVLMGILPIFKPVFKDYKEMDNVAKAFFKNLTPSWGINETNYPFYAQLEVMHLNKIIDEFKTIKKYNFDLLSILATLKTTSANNYILRHADNFNFYNYITLSNSNLKKTKKIINEGLMSGDELLDATGYNRLIEKKGLVYLDHDENKNIEVEVKAKFEEHKQNMKDHILNYHLRNIKNKYGLGTMLGSYPHLGDQYFIKYIDVLKNMQEKKSIPLKNRFEQLYGNDPDINNADYTLFLDLKFNKGHYVEKTCIYWLKEMFKEGLVFTKDDYKELKRLITEKHYRLDRDLILYYELIKYICGAYPSFVQRYIDANAEYLEQRTAPRIWTTEIIGNEEERKILNDYINTSRVDYDAPKKLIKYNPKNYYNTIRNKAL